MTARYSKDELARSAYEILNELMGDIHGARIPGIIAIRKPDIFMTKYSKYIIRSAITVIVLSLRKFDDLWTHQIKSTLLAGDLPSEGNELHEEIKKRKLRKFCNVVLAHYAYSKISPKTPTIQIETLILQQGFSTDEEFLKWTREVIKKLEVVRDKISEKYCITKINSEAKRHK